MFLDLRLTPKFFNDPDNWCLGRSLILINKWFGHDIVKYMACEEKLDKFGNETHEHYHINVEVEDELNKEKIQKWLRRDFNCKGNKAYCLRVHVDLQDEDRWWRYCCKENLVKSKGFEKDRLKELTMLAKDERERQVGLNCATRDKLVNKNQFRDKMFAWLKKEYPDLADKRSLFIKIGTYYQENSKTPPFSKMMDVVLDYLVYAGHMTFGDYYDNKY